MRKGIGCSENRQSRTRYGCKAGSGTTQKKAPDSYLTFKHCFVAILFGRAQNSKCQSLKPTSYCSEALTKGHKHPSFVFPLLFLMCFFRLSPPGPRLCLMFLQSLPLSCAVMSQQLLICELIPTINTFYYLFSLLLPDMHAFNKNLFLYIMNNFSIY